MFIYEVYLIVGDTDYNCSFFSAAAQIADFLKNPKAKLNIIMPSSFKNIPNCVESCGHQCFYKDSFYEVKEHIKKGWKFDNLQNSGKALFYFVGHGLVGVGKFKYNDEEIAYEELYKVFFDFKYNLDTIEIYGKRDIYCVLDACYSGQALDYAGKRQNYFIPTLTSVGRNEMAYATVKGTLFTERIIRFLGNIYSPYIFKPYLPNPYLRGHFLCHPQRN